MLPLVQHVVKRKDKTLYITKYCKYRTELSNQIYSNLVFYSVNKLSFYNKIFSKKEVKTRQFKKENKEKFYAYYNQKLS